MSRENQPHGTEPPAELSVARAVDAIRNENGELRALCQTQVGEALARDAELASAPERGLLHRMPFALKDVWDVRGLPTTRGHWPERDRIARTTSPVAQAFLDAGAVLVGKSNLSDSGLTPESASYVGGTTKNPLDPTRTAGGSSGGAACAVAASMAAFDWGTDFGGSIRLPAAFCGVVGLRLSQALWPIPREGRQAPPTIERLNGMGPLARDLVTCRAALRAASRLRAPIDAPAPPSAVALYGPDASCLGLWPDFVRELEAHLASCDVTVRPARLPPPRAADRAFVSLIASHAGELFRGRRLALAIEIASALSVGPLVGDWRLHPASARVLAELSILRVLRDRDREAARREAERVRDAVGALFDRRLVLVTPTSTFPAPRLGRALRTRGLASFVKLGNLADATALSVPFGRFDDGMPRGLQLLGPPGSESALLDLAAAIAPALADRAGRRRPAHRL